MSSNPGSEYLLFAISDNCYAIDILYIQEIRTFVKPQPIATAPNYILGMLDFDHQIVPIIDFRVLVQEKNIAYLSTTITILIKSKVDFKIYGLVVDAVSDVSLIDKDMLLPPPVICNSLAANYIAKVATINQKLIAILDIEKLLGHVNANVFTGVDHAAKT